MASPAEAERGAARLLARTRMISPATASATNSTARAVWRVMRKPIVGTALMAMPANGDQTGSLPATTSTASTPATASPIMNTDRANPLLSRMPTSLWESALNAAAVTTAATTQARPRATSRPAPASTWKAPLRRSGS